MDWLCMRGALDSREGPQSGEQQQEVAPNIHRINVPQVYSKRVEGGGRWAYLLEHRALTGKATRKLAWVKGTVDLAELAKLRRSRDLTIQQIAAHFGVGTTTIKSRLQTMKRGGS
jgi:hypothetical protein